MAGAHTPQGRPAASKMFAPEKGRVERGGQLTAGFIFTFFCTWDHFPSTGLMWTHKTRMTRRPTAPAGRKQAPHLPQVPQNPEMSVTERSGSPTPCSQKGSHTCLPNCPMSVFFAPGARVDEPLLLRSLPLRLKHSPNKVSILIFKNVLLLEKQVAPRIQLFLLRIMISEQNSQGVTI